MTTVPDRIADPGFTLAMVQKEAAMAELRSLGVPVDSAAAIVQRIYSIGYDRGLYRGLRPRDATPSAEHS